MMLKLETFLPYRINVLAKRISKELARRYQDQVGISIPEWRVIAILGHDQPLSSNDIVERSRMDKARVSRAVTALVDRGMLARAPHPQDQRLLRLSFTPAGRDLYERVSPLALEWEAHLLDGLSPDERKQLTRLLDRLEGRLDRMAVDGAGEAASTGKSAAKGV